ncbi:MULTISPECIES: DUF1659 domain-containing protein [unclassified Psychrobacillus]|uniref:DUF1659 domain-containing protein n=1 Tax=unclassified Psychrobacillus TaxID=2636677 RepID=UPI00146F2A18|nr:DUF1659 domain-containing protein [Psychrobacillus sp. BL-248-WT-3]NME05454.1 DUF1659 domain-containing protein [Psychrobacillus sp. BL-248-WT-3]
MANLEHKHSVLRITFEAGMGENGKLKTKSKTYRNVKASATADQLEAAVIILSGLSASPFIIAEKVQTSNLN